VGFVSDRDIVAAIVAGDPADLSAAYDRYAPGLFGYCRSFLGEPADAADAVQDTFVIAAAKLGGLRNPARLRSWLYAVARNECHGRLRARARLADLDEAGEMTDDVDGVVGFAQREELRSLMLDAIGGLNPGDREVIELNLRHDLEGPDLAGVLGVPVGQAHALASRARGQLERALGALLVARTGRRDCIELDAILDSWDGKLTALWRKRVSRHIESCDICAERKREVLSPAMLLSVLPLAPLPAGLRDHLMRLVSDDSPEAIGYRGRVVSRAGAFDPAGFPLQTAPVEATGRSGRFRGAGGAGGSGAGGAGGAGPGGGGSGRHHAGERSMTVLLAAAAAVVLLLGGGVATTYALLAGGSHAKPAAHRKSEAGALSTTATSSPPSVLPSSLPSQPSAAPDPTPAGGPTMPAASHSTAPPKSSPPAKSSGPAKSSPPASSPPASTAPPTTMSVSAPPPTTSAPTPTTSPTSPAAGRSAAGSLDVTVDHSFGRLA
jgi:RNA polymerase sigma factor (sigma-70 family)